MTEIKQNRVYILLFAYILMLYAGFFNHGKMELSRTATGEYQYLTEGFLSGKLSLSLQPSHELLQLADPYNPELRVMPYPHDASLYQGQYYLYFGSLPVITFYLPFKFFTGFYPSDGMAVLFFTTTGLLALMLLLINIRKLCFPAISEAQLLFAMLLLAFTNNSIYLLKLPRFYEAAISSAFCAMSIALYFLFNLFAHPVRRRDLIFFSLFLALAVAGRAHFSLVCLSLIPAVFIYAWRLVPENKLTRLILPLLLPSISIAILLMLYNYLRFHSIFEFGQNYQLGGYPLAMQRRLYSFKNFYQNMIPGLYFYFIHSYKLHFAYGFIPIALVKSYSSIASSAGDFISLNYSVGVACIAPFIIYLAALPKIFSRQNDAVIRYFLGAISIIPLTIILFLLTRPFKMQRYDSDFTSYLFLIAILCAWYAEKNASTALQANIIKTVFYSLGFYSIYVAISIVTMGPC